MPPFGSIDLPHYCETAHSGWIAEPLNAVSSLAVLVAAAYGLVAWRKRGNADRATLLLVVTTFLIGINSAVFHSVRTSFSLFADVVPILLFVLTIFAILLVHLFRQTVLVTMIHLAGFLAGSVMVMVMLTPRAFGNGAWYVVPLGALYVLGAILILRARLGMHDDAKLMGAAAVKSNSRHFPELKIGYALVQTGVLLAIGLLVRSLDLKLCNTFPIGMHMLWHIVIAAAVAVVMLALIRHTSPHQPVVDPLADSAAR